MQIRVGLVGTGYAAERRAETFQADDRSTLIAVAGHSTQRTQAFCQQFQVEACDDWLAIVHRPDIDLVVVSNTNQLHGTIVKAALEAGKHVVVEYPLSLDSAEAEALINLAEQKGCLLHVEHIDVLSGIHEAIASSLAQLGKIFYVRHTSLRPDRPAPQKWTYSLQLFGFPFFGALSRIHRLTHLLGSVTAVSGQARFWNAQGKEVGSSETDYFSSTLCQAQIEFANQTIAHVIYGKGEAIWRSDRSFEAHGERGGVFIDGMEGVLFKPEGEFPLTVGSRRGLFARDTAAVLDYLTKGTELYIHPTSSLHALKVAEAIQRSAKIGQRIELS